MFAVLMLSLVTTSCKKYPEIAEAKYSEQSFYMPAAVEGNSVNGIYLINAVATPGQTFRYIADVPGSKLNIPLAVYKAGVNTSGATVVNIAANADTVNKLILANRFPAVTELLPADKYSLSTSSVTIPDGKSNESFTISVDLNFLLANLTKKFAVAVTIASSKKVTSSSNTTVVYIDPSFLIPTANFTRTINNRTVTFSNNSLNANVWSWNYGDGSAVSTQKVAPYTYEAAGTYTITLTAKGALGNFNQATFTANVIIP